MTVLQQLGLHMLAIPLCHLIHLVAGAVLRSPALGSASQLRLAALAEALVLPEAAARAEKQAGALQLSAADTSQHQQVQYSALTLLDAVSGYCLQMSAISA